MELCPMIQIAIKLQRPTVKIYIAINLTASLYIQHPFIVGSLDFPLFNTIFTDIPLISKFAQSFVIQLCKPTYFDAHLCYCSLSPVQQI